MSADDEKAKLDLGIFSAIMTHWDVKDIDANAIAEKFETSQQKVAGMVYASKNTPRAFNELVAYGANLGQIPPWIMRPGQEGAPTSPPETPITVPLTPTSPPITEVDLGRTQETPPPGTGGQEVPLDPRRAPEVGGTALNSVVPPRGGGNRLGRIYDGVRYDGERLAALGIVRTEDGRYLRAATNPDGSPGFVVVDPSEIESPTLSRMSALN